MLKSTAGHEYRGRRVLVVGLGLHGGAASAVRWFARQGAILRIQDLKTRQQLAPTIRRLRSIQATYHLGGHPAEDFDWAEYIYLNQGVGGLKPLALVAQARARGVPILNETTIFFEHCPAPIVGVTGTRGKSTTTVLLSQILNADRRSVVAAGNLRQMMMLDILPRLKPTDLPVLELSSFQLEYLPTVHRSPQVAIMTNLKVDHLNRYDTMGGYADAKFNIFRWQHRHDVAVLNGQNAWTRQAAALTPATVWWFQTTGHRGAHGLTVSAGWVVEYHGSRRQRLFPVSAIHIPGRHTLENVLAAATAARAMNVPAATIRRAVESFAGLPHRQELVRTWRRHTFYNDTTATTPDGALAALEVFPKAVFIIGGSDKRLDFGPFIRRLRRQPQLVFLPGTATQKIINGLRRRGDRRSFSVAASMDQAVHQAVEMSKPNQPIVLSPGAASFGLFVHEFDRGQQFVRTVQRLQ